MTAVFVLVVGTRFLLPLLIPRYPLPAIVACLVVDGVDQTIFQAFGYDPPGYQGYDKAMDVYYLAIAYLATMRNWTSRGGFQVGRFLYFYRLLGVLAFEVFQMRAMLLVFANTFEYFFIAYETVRTRWDPRRLSLTDWVVVAAALWVCVKLPQEYWIHVAQLDMTDTLGDHAWAPWLLGGLLLALAVVVWFVVLPRTPHPDHPLRLAADPLPEEMDTAAEQAAWRAGSSRLWSLLTLEKVVLVGLLSVIFSQSLPGLHVSKLELFVGVAVLIVVNTAVVIAAAQRQVSFESLVVTFLVRIAVNVVLVLVARIVLGPTDLNVGHALFFVLLLSLLTSMHDRYQPMYVARVVRERQGTST
jgi:hypothetical protein